MLCPKCENKEMETQSVAGIEIDRCPECHGIWLDALELESLLKRDIKPLLEADGQFEAVTRQEGRRLHCPRCKGTYLIKLNSRLRPGTIVDSCTTCFGTWLDAGELTRLAGDDFARLIAKLFGAP
ncbi:MAG: zf-TFIIB domain-containing protein [Phycisphaerae bacterium]|nr:zf-TFIIB domain-containing protein [Phycisphaerae bacterium]